MAQNWQVPRVALRYREPPRWQRTAILAAGNGILAPGLRGGRWSQRREAPERAVCMAEIAHRRILLACQSAPNAA